MNRRWRDPSVIVGIVGIVVSGFFAGAQVYVMEMTAFSSIRYTTETSTVAFTPTYVALQAQTLTGTTSSASISYTFWLCCVSTYIYRPTYTSPPTYTTRITATSTSFVTSYYSALYTYSRIASITATSTSFATSTTTFAVTSSHPSPPNVVTLLGLIVAIVLLVSCVVGVNWVLRRPQA